MLASMPKAMVLHIIGKLESCITHGRCESEEHKFNTSTVVVAVYHGFIVGEVKQSITWQCNASRRSMVNNERCNGKAQPFMLTTQGEFSK